MSHRHTCRRAFSALTTISIAEANARRTDDEVQQAIDIGTVDAVIDAQVEFFGTAAQVML